MQTFDHTLAASVASCPLTALSHARKEEDGARCPRSADLKATVIGAGKSVKSELPAFGSSSASPISTTSAEDLLPPAPRNNTAKGLPGLRCSALCCCAPYRCSGRVVARSFEGELTGTSVSSSPTSDEWKMMKRGQSERRPSRDSLSSTGTTTRSRSFLQLFKRKSSTSSARLAELSEQTLINSSGNLHGDSPTESFGTPNGKRTTSWSHIPGAVDGRAGGNPSASIAASVPDIGSTMSLSSLPHSFDNSARSVLCDSLPVLTKEPAPGKTSTMPGGSQATSQANGRLHNSTSSGHVQKASSSSSSAAGSSGYGPGAARYSHKSSSQSMVSAEDGSRKRSAGTASSGVSESQRALILQAATKPDSSTSRLHAQENSPTARLAGQLEDAHLTKPRTRSSVPAPRPSSLHQEETSRHAVSSSRRHQPPMIPMFPMGSSVALQQFRNRLTEYEHDEVLEYNDVHYLGLEAQKIHAVRGTTQNHGYDEENGSYLSMMKDHIAYRFEIKEVLGKGSFGHVVKGLDHRTNHYVAIKIIRNKRRFHQQAQVELKILANLNRKDKEGAYNIIRMEDSFHFRNHLCIVFELMGMNLYEVLKANNYRGFSLSVIRKITYSLLQCLKLLRRENIIHCDLKPENILLRPSGHMAVKVIDFGSSCYEHQRVYTYIQSRFYRSPEVILGLPYTCAIDMWSLGCILPELYTGYPLFPGENENEQLACIMQIKGLPPSRLLDIAPRRRQFFDSQGNPRNIINSKGKRRQPGTRSMASACDTSDPLFINFIQQCLHWEAGQRMLPDEGLRHHWIMQGRQPRSQTAGYTSDSSAMHSSRARSGTTTSTVSGTGTGTGTGSRTRHYTAAPGGGSTASTSSTLAHLPAGSSTAPGNSLQHRPQPIGAEQPSEPVTKSSKTTASMSKVSSVEGKDCAPLDGETRHVVGATTQEKNSESSKKVSASWSNPSNFLNPDIV